MPVDPPLMEGFEILLRGEPFVEQARRSLSPAADEYHWTTHTEKLGGPKPVEEAAIVERGQDGKVARYALFSPGATLHQAAFEEQRARLTLRDGTLHELALTAAPDLILQQNLLLQLSRVLATLNRGEGPRRLHYFSPEALAMREIEVTPTGASDWDTSIGVRLKMGTGGDLVSATRMDAQETLIGQASTPIFHPHPLDSLRVSEPNVEPPAVAPGVEREEVAFDSDDVTIHGLFVHPGHMQNSMPAVLFFNGSGSITRWGGAPGMRLKTLETMDALARAGAASLAMDSRGAGQTGFGKADRLLGATRLADALAGWRWMTGNPNIDGQRLFAVGHSLGALVLLELLQAQPELSPLGIVLLAPPGRPLRAVIMEQSAREARRLQLSTEEANARETALRNWFDRESSNDNPDLRLGGLRPLTDPAILDADPLELIGAARCPVLILHGNKDIQTSAELDAEALHRAALRRNVASTLIEIGDADHLFRLEPQISTPERYMQDLPPNQEYLTILTRWIMKRAAAAPEGSAD